MIARHTYFLENTLSPERELGFGAFYVFEIVHFSAARFTCVGLPCILFFFPLKRVCHEVIFRFGRPLLLLAGAIGAAVADGAGASTGAISHGLMLDVGEGKNEAGS